LPWRCRGRLSTTPPPAPSAARMSCRFGTPI